MALRTFIRLRHNTLGIPPYFIKHKHLGVATISILDEIVSAFANQWPSLVTHNLHWGRKPRLRSEQFRLDTVYREVEERAFSKLHDRWNLERTSLIQVSKAATAYMASSLSPLDLGWQMTDIFGQSLVGWRKLFNAVINIRLRFSVPQNTEIKSQVVPCIG